jgi:hypothetical protein
MKDKTKSPPVTATSEKRKARSEKRKARSDKVACRRLALLAIVQSERRLFTVPLTRKEEEAAAQVTRADELEVLKQQAQADLSHKQAQLDLAERMNQNLQRQAVDQAAESERSKQAEIQQLQNVIIGL